MDIISLLLLIILFGIFIKILIDFISFIILDVFKEDILIWQQKDIENLKKKDRNRKSWWEDKIHKW